MVRSKRYRIKRRAYNRYRDARGLTGFARTYRRGITARDKQILRNLERGLVWAITNLDKNSKQYISSFLYPHTGQPARNDSEAVRD